MIVNSNDYDLKTSITLSSFLISNNYNINTIAIELNSKIIPKKDYDITYLNNSDILEIVCFFGGG